MDSKVCFVFLSLLISYNHYLVIGTRHSPPAIIIALGVFVSSNFCH